MSVIIEAINVIVAAARIDAQYPGGIAQFERDCPNGTYCADGHIVRVGFMSPEDVSRFVKHLEARGLTFYDGQQFVDIAVVDQNQGPTAPCSWLDFGFHFDGFKYATLKGQDPNPIVGPAGWDPKWPVKLTFVANDEIAGRLVPLAREGSADVLLDAKRGREVYVNRAYLDRSPMTRNSDEE